MAPIAPPGPPKPRPPSAQDGRETVGEISPVPSPSPASGIDPRPITPTVGPTLAQQAVADPRKGSLPRIQHVGRSCPDCKSNMVLGSPDQGEFALFLTLRNERDIPINAVAAYFCECGRMYWDQPQLPKPKGPGQRR